jgi:hypothetical protein
MHDSNKDAPIYRDLSGDGGEFRRALQHACAGLRPCGALIFHPGETDWGCFYRSVFAEQVAPQFAAAHSAAGAGEISRLVALDERFGAALGAASRERLASAAPAVFEARAGAGAMRLLNRLQERRPGCTFTTAFAAHAASFHVSLLHALVAYLAVEWRAGHEAGGTLALENSREWEKMFAEQLLASPEPIRQVLARSLRGWAEVA